jgi:uncharacterized protein (DUF433 family)
MVQHDEAVDARMTTSTDQPTIVRTGRGLTIAGTRITLYDVMDYVTADCSAAEIQQYLRLTERQIADALAYIASHRAEVETEYQLVLQRAEEIRQYWEERNRERLAEIAAMPPKPGQEELRAKLDAWKARL